MRQSRGVLRRREFLRALGAAMRERRVRLALTIVEVARRSGESPGSLRRLEAGERNVSLLDLARIARALELPLPALLRQAERILGRR